MSQNTLNLFHLYGDSTVSRGFKTHTKITLLINRDMPSSRPRSSDGYSGFVCVQTCSKGCNSITTSLVQYNPGLEFTLKESYEFIFMNDLCGRATNSDLDSWSVLSCSNENPPWALLFIAHVTIKLSCLFE